MERRDSPAEWTDHELMPFLIEFKYLGDDPAFPGEAEIQKMIEVRLLELLGKGGITHLTCQLDPLSAELIRRKIDNSGDITELLDENDIATLFAVMNQMVEENDEFDYFSTPDLRAVLEYLGVEGLVELARGYLWSALNLVGEGQDENDISDCRIWKNQVSKLESIIEHEKTQLLVQIITDENLY